MSDVLLGTVVVPVASSDDARVTATALDEYADDIDRVTVVHVIERSGAPPEETGEDGRTGASDEALAAFETAFDGSDVEGRRVYSTDVVDGILDVAAGVGATAVVFTPREGGRLVRYLSGDVALRLVTEAPIPVISLPRSDADA